MANAMRLADSDEAIELACQLYTKALGRPTKYQPELVAEILTRMQAGESVNKILRDDRMPTWSLLGKWRANHPSFDRAYAQARKMQGDAAASRVLETSNDLIDNADTMTAQQAKCTMYAQRGLQWIAERSNPDDWQETKRVQVSHTHNVADRLARARVIDAEIIEPEGEGEGG